MYRTCTPTLLGNLHSSQNITKFLNVFHCAGYSSLPRSCHSAGLDGAGMGDLGSGGMPLSSPYCPDNTLPLLETVAEDQEIHTRRNNGGYTF